MWRDNSTDICLRDVASVSEIRDGIALTGHAAEVDGVAEVGELLDGSAVAATRQSEIMRTVERSYYIGIASSLSYAIGCAGL